MARTEKKFGQVNQPASYSSSELVPTSSNRRNVLVNVTGRSASSVTIFTTTGAPSVTLQASIGSFRTVTAPTGLTATGIAGFAINPAKTKLFHFGSSGTSYGYSTLTATSSTLAVSGSLSYAHSTQWQAIDATNNIARNDFNNVGVHSNRIVYIDDEYLLGYSPNQGDGGTAASSHRYGMLRHQAGSITSVTTNYTTPAGAADAILFRASAIALQRPTSTTGIGYILAMHNQESTTTNAVELMGMYLYSSGAESGRIWWSGTATANKTAGRAAQFFLCGDYNHTNPVFAFSHTTNASDPWLNTTATGGSGTLATNIPKIPAGASNAGFRLVANDGAFGTDRKYLDGTVSYPAAPTGVTLPTAASTDPQVISLKFSPNGEYLAVMYNRSGTITTTADSAVVIYTRQNDGTYTHTHSSGTAIPRIGFGNDSMAWSSDSSSIYVVSDANTIQVWNPFAGTSSVPVSNIPTAAKTVAYTKYPYVKSVYDAASPSSSSLITTSNVTPVNTAETQSNSAFAVFHIPVSGHAGIAVAPALNGTVATISVAGTNLAATIGTATTAPNYVNTVAQDISVASGSVTQISNIVLESGERLYIEPADSNAVDVVAYGVEIS